MAATADNKKYYCEKCNKTMGANQFYTSNNTEKYKNDGKLNQCKQCLTMHVDNWDPDTYLWILQEIDVPYIPKEWNRLLQTYGKDRSKVTGMTILGRYLSIMKLNQWKDFRWKDTEYLQEVANNEIVSTMKLSGYDAAQIDEAVRKSTFIMPQGELREPAPPPEAPEVSETPTEDYFARQCDAPPIELDLTDEDRLNLRLKWGDTYRPEEWVKLEQLYEEMMESYDIQTAGHIDTLKLVCKTSLKANQLLDIGDVDGAQKMVKMYDGLMKSGKFTAAQNKAENGEYVDSVSELVALCETDGFIPRYYTDGPQDKVDRVLQDLQHYTRTLVTEEMNLGNLIENAVKQIEIDKQKEAEEASEAADDDDVIESKLFDEDTKYIEDEDFEEFEEFEDENKKKDAEFLTSLVEGVEE